MTDLEPVLERLGLEQYLPSFIHEGFDTWETVLDITESDLDVLQVKLGHRRKLQREIANARGISVEQVIQAPVRAASHESTLPGPEEWKAGSSKGGSKTLSSGKRRYRRHPKVREAVKPNVLITPQMPGAREDRDADQAPAR
jgi:hypothetical protein